MLETSHTKTCQGWYNMERGNTDDLKVEAALLRYEAEVARTFESDLAGLLSEVSIFQGKAGHLEVAEQHASAIPILDNVHWHGSRPPARANLVSLQAMPLKQGNALPCSPVVFPPCRISVVARVRRLIEKLKLILL